MELLRYYDGVVSSDALDGLLRPDWSRLVEGKFNNLFFKCQPSAINQNSELSISRNSNKSTSRPYFCMCSMPFWFRTPNEIQRRPKNNFPTTCKYIQNRWEDFQASLGSVTGRSEQVICSAPARKALQNLNKVILSTNKTFKLNQRIFRTVKNSIRQSQIMLDHS